MLTGGGAKLGGLTAMAEQMLGHAGAAGEALRARKMGEPLLDPAFATVVGLVTYGNRLQLMRDSGDKGLVTRIWSALRGKELGGSGCG